MSVTVTFCSYGGIVMAADSRTSLTKNYPDERITDLYDKRV